MAQPVLAVHHIPKKRGRVENRVFEIQMQCKPGDMADPVPDKPAQALGQQLVIPSARTAQVPLGMVTREIVAVSRHCH